MLLPPSSDGTTQPATASATAAPSAVAVATAASSASLPPLPHRLRHRRRLSSRCRDCRLLQPPSPPHTRTGLIGKAVLQWSKHNVSFIGRAYVGKQNLQSQLVHLLSFDSLPAQLTTLNTLIYGYISLRAAWAGLCRPRRRFPAFCRAIRQLSLTGTIAFRWSHRTYSPVVSVFSTNIYFEP